MDDVRSAPFQPSSSSSSVDDIPLENHHASVTSTINFDDDADDADDALYAFFDHGLLETLFYDEMIMDHGGDNPNSSGISFRGEGATTGEVLVSSGVTTKEDASCCKTDEHYSHVAAAVAVAPPFLPQPPSSISGGTSSHTSSTGIVVASSTTATQHYIPFSNNTIPAIATPSITSDSTTTAAASAYPMSTTTTTMNEHQLAALQAEYRNGLAAAAVLSQRQQQQQQQQLLINTATTTTRSTPGLLPATTSSLYPISSIPFSTNSTSITNNTNPYTYHSYPNQPPYQTQPQQTLLQSNATTKKKRKTKKSPLAKPSSTTISILTPYQNSNSMNAITKSLQQHQQQIVYSSTTATNTATATNQISSHHSKDNTPSPLLKLPPCNYANTILQHHHNNHTDQNKSNSNHNKPAATTSLEEAEKLVTHFASLAEKLGISLPQNVLASLTRTAAVMHGERQQQPKPQPDILLSSLPQQQHITTMHPWAITPLSVTHSHHPQDLHTEPKLITSFIPPSSSVSTQQQQQQQNSSAIASKIVNQTLPITNENEIIPSILSKIPPLPPSVAEHKGNVNNNQEGVESVDGNITNAFAICALDKEEQENTIDTEGIGAVTVQPHSEEKTTTTAAASLSMAPKKRKRPRVEECARKLSALKDENRILKLHLDAVLEKTKTADLERAQAERDMREMVQYKDRTAVDKEKLQKLVTRFTEMYADYGKSRQQELRFHLEQLRKLATPSTFTKMSLWTLGQNDRFFHNPKKKSLGDILRFELQITPIQMKKIVERRQSIRSLTANIKQALDLLEKLRLLCEWKQQIFHSRMSKCQEVLTPMQVVKLLIWVDDNAETLNNFCPGWGSERIKGTGSPSHDLPSAALNLGEPFVRSLGKENTILPSSEPTS